MINKLKKILFILLQSKLVLPIFAQVYVPFNNIDNYLIEKNLLSDTTYHSTFLKPYYSLSNPNNNDSIKHSNWFKRKLLYESFISIDSNDFSMYADPLFNFGYSYDYSAKTTYYDNTRGVFLYGQLNKTLFFETSFLENQSGFPLYLSDYINSSLITPGQGQARRFGDNGFDYSYATGSLLVNLCKKVKITVGNGKLFAGNGYRSLLLSDVSFPYPYLNFAFTSKYWKIYHINAILLSDTIPLSSYGLREKRIANFNIISWTPNHKVEFSIIEAGVFHYPNNKKNRSINMKSINPFIFTNTITQDSDYSSLLGINNRLILFKNITLYNQFAFFNPIKNLNLKNMAYQFGIKFFNLLSLNDLFLQLEYNQAGKEIYNVNDSLIRYSHFNQPLAHPYGNNFQELAIITSYMFKRWFFYSKQIIANYGSKDITPLKKRSRFVNKIQYETPFISNGPYTTLWYCNISISYIFNYKSNRLIEIGIINRNGKLNNTKYQNQYLYFSFKTNLSNNYYDF